MMLIRESNPQCSGASSQSDREPDGIGVDHVEDAGSDLLHHYQLIWSDLHRSSEEAAKSAEDVDRLCYLIFQSVLKRQKIVRQLDSLINSLPELEQSATLIADDLSQTLDLLNEVEQAISAKEEAIFVMETRKRFDSQYVLKIHEEKLNREFDKIAISLETDHLKRMNELAKSEEKAVKEKQESFKRAFEKEMMEYKVSGRIRRPENNASNSIRSLDQIHVEPDEDDKQDLEHFLAEESIPSQPES